jgi:NitT/TauT family transport system ATP-binding protein
VTESTPTEQPRIRLVGVTKTFDLAGANRKLTALGEVNIDLAQGEFFSVIGPSGCGKSTILNIIAGLEKPDAGGQVLVDGKPIKGPGPDRAVVFQEAGLLPWLTVRGNVEYGLTLAGLSAAERRKRSEHYLKMVHLSRYSQSMPHELSGGMRQRVSIARALALEPRVLLMDEPFSALDAQTRDLLLDELQSIWQQTRTTVVFITHNVREAVFLSTRVMVMTAPPGQVKSLLKIPLGFPRLKTGPDMAIYVQKLEDQIRDEVNKVAARELDQDWTPEAELAAREAYADAGL